MHVTVLITHIHIPTDTFQTAGLKQLNIYMHKCYTRILQTQLFLLASQRLACLHTAVAKRAAAILKMPRLLKHYSNLFIITVKLKQLNVYAHALHHPETNPQKYLPF